MFCYTVAYTGEEIVLYVTYTCTIYLAALYIALKACLHDENNAH